MPYIVTDLPKLTISGSSGGTQFTNQIGRLDDASSISLFFTSSALSAVAAIQVSQFDPVDPSPLTGASPSTNWYNLSTAIATFTSSASQLFINNISFRGLRLQITATSSDNGEVMAFACKQITVGLVFGLTGLAAAVVGALPYVV